MTDLYAYDRLVRFLERCNATYRVIDHEPEGRTEIISRIRGHDTADAVKCMVVMVKLNKKHKIHVLAVVPGDCRIDLNAIKTLKGGVYAGIASPSIAEELTGCPVGAILPFSFDERLELIVDPAVFDRSAIYFNPGRLDQSIELQYSDYRRIVAGEPSTRFTASLASICQSRSSRAGSEQKSG